MNKIILFIVLNATFLSTLCENESLNQSRNRSEHIEACSVESSDTDTHYCPADVKIKENVNKSTSSTLDVSLSTTFAEKSNSTVLKSRFYNNTLKPDAASNDTPVYRDSQKFEVPVYGTDIYVVVFLHLLLLAVVTISTICSRYYPQTTSQTMFAGIVKSFDLKDNAHNFLYSQSNFKILDGIRFLSACAMVYFHVHAYYSGLGYIKESKSERVPRNLHYTFINNLHLVVDTFFTISGLLLGIGLMSASEKPINIFNMAVKRYFRLMGCFVETLLIFYVGLKYSPKGIWLELATKEMETCSNYWWRHILMISNYLDTSNICYIASWTIPYDFHLTMITILVFWVYQKNRRTGIIIFTLLFIASILLPGAVTYMNRLPHSPIFNQQFNINIRTTLFLMPTYVWSHLRAGPYFVGVILGCKMALYKPKNYRNVISKRLSIIAVFLILGVILSMFYTIELLHHRPYNVLEASVFAATFRSVWALAVCLLVVICEYGNLSLITNFLSWSAFGPLSKLSYGVYLYNCAVIQWGLLRIHGTIHYDRLAILLITLEVIAISIAASFVQWFCVEAPVNKFVGFAVQTRKSINKEDSSKREETKSDVKLKAS